ncbi:hypothetical protein [Acinetobacter sp. 1125_18A]|uniref:hypothetical protein n=1 Tax=Acinetobacter sp. 1125_18A TaxID=2605959 RepID=UPI004058A241
MNNINQETQSYNEIPNTYQIVNKVPEKQAIVLQNTNKDYPIQLRVDPVTDYTALGITVLASVIVSIIAAMVTVLLVKDSNKNLVNTQRESQDNLFRMQKKELNAKSRSERLNQIREFASNINLISNQIPRMMLDINAYKFLQPSNAELSNKAITDFQTELKNFMKYNYNLRLYLLDMSAGEKLIISNIEEFIKTLNEIFPIVFNIEVYVTWKNFNEDFEGNKLKLLSDKIASSIENYLKEEWDKILQLSE